MGEQMELDIQSKEEVFYVRCRKKVKQALYLQMHKDGFSSMADWFEQYVTGVFIKGKKNAKSKVVAKKKRNDN